MTQKALLRFSVTFFRASGNTAKIFGIPAPYFSSPWMGFLFLFTFINCLGSYGGVWSLLFLFFFFFSTIAYKRAV